MISNLICTYVPNYNSPQDTCQRLNKPLTICTCSIYDILPHLSCLPLCGRVSFGHDDELIRSKLMRQPQRTRRPTHRERMRSLVRRTTKAPHQKLWIWSVPNGTREDDGSRFVQCPADVQRRSGCKRRTISDPCIISIFNSLNSYRLRFFCHTDYFLHSN